MKLLYKQFAEFDSDQLIGVSIPFARFHFSFLSFFFSDNVRDGCKRSWNQSVFETTDKLEEIDKTRNLQKTKLPFLSWACFSDSHFY